MLKLIEIPPPKLKFKKNCPWELKSINTVLIFILECWDLKTCEYVFDVETCKQKVAQGTIFCCLFCLSTAIYLYSWKKCSRIKHDQSNACLTKHKRYEQNPKKDVPNQYLKSILRPTKKSIFLVKMLFFNSYWKKSKKEAKSISIKKVSSGSISDPQGGLRTENKTIRNPISAAFYIYFEIMFAPKKSKIEFI